MLLSAAERAERRKRRTVAAPEVRVPALWKESGFAVIGFLRISVCSAGSGMSTGREFEGRSERVRRKAAGRKSLSKIPGVCAGRPVGTDRRGDQDLPRAGLRATAVVA